MGLPIAVLCIPLCWISIVKILKPEQLESSAYDSLRQAAEGKLEDAAALIIRRVVGV